MGVNHNFFFSNRNFFASPATKIKPWLPLHQVPAPMLPIIRLVKLNTTLPAGYTYTNRGLSVAPVAMPNTYSTTLLAYSKLTKACKRLCQIKTGQIKAT